MGRPFNKVEGPGAATAVTLRHSRTNGRPCPRLVPMIGQCVPTHCDDRHTSRPCVGDVIASGCVSLWRPLVKHPAADISACRDRDPASAQPVMENPFLGIFGFKSLPNAEVLFSKSSVRPGASFQLAEQSIDPNSGSTSVRDRAMRLQSRLGYV